MNTLLNNSTIANIHIIDPSGIYYPSAVIRHAHIYAPTNNKMNIRNYLVA